MDTEREKFAGLATAVVPAHNEEPRIASVLEVLSQARTIGEVIVVDDGSSDGTAAAVSAFSRVRYLRNPDNRGKGVALNKGVEAASGGVVFFCDADLAGLEPWMVDEIVSPVLAEEIDMFVGARSHRNNFLVKTFVRLEILAGIYPTTGQRALRRELWEKLPEYYKRDYRVEVGLNFLARRHGRGLQFRKFAYGHTKKERKLGLLKGLTVKLDMYLDVIKAALRARFVDWLHLPSHRERPQTSG